METLKMIEVEYDDKKEEIVQSKNYIELIEAIGEKFNLSEDIMENATLLYVDEDDCQNILDEDIFNKDEDAKKSNKIILKINEINNNDREEEQEKEFQKEFTKNLLNKKEEIIQQIQEYKDKLFNICIKTLENKLKEKEKIHSENIKILKEAYTQSLNKIKEENKKQSELIIKKFTEEIKNNFAQELDNINENSLNDLKNNIKKISNAYEEEVKNIRLKSITSSKEELKGLLEEARDSFIKLRSCKNIKNKNNSNKKYYCEFTHNNIEKSINLNDLEKNGFDLETEIKNIGLAELPKECIFEFFVDGERDAKTLEKTVDLSSIKPKEKKIVKETFTLGKIENSGEKEISIKICYDNKEISSNPLIINLKVNEFNLLQ